MPTTNRLQCPGNEKRLILLPMRRMALAVAFAALVPYQALSQTEVAPESRPVDLKKAGLSLRFVETTKKPDYDKGVLRPLYKSQAEKFERGKSECEAKEGHIEEGTCILPPPPPVPPPYPQPVHNPGNVDTATLLGSLGYTSPFGNCVLEPGVNNPGYGNPIDWPVLYSVPRIGSTVLFFFNHTAVVTGIWSNGDLEVRHQNAPGAPTRYPASLIRGYR